MLGMSGSQTPPGSADAPSTDPSMEDILASIRRILSEDEKEGVTAEAPPVAAPPAPAPAPVMADPPPEDDDVLVLDTSMMVANPGPETPLASPEPPPPPELPPEPPPRPDVAPPHAADDLELLAPATAAAATASVSGLMRALAQERASQVYRGGPTIEDLVREEVRPILKDWLDTHLPGIVERLVRAEIERVVGRAVP